MIDDQRKQMRSTLRKQMETMSPRGRSFAQYAMKRNDAKRSLSQLAAHVDPKFRVSIFSDREADTRTYRSSK